MGVRLRVRLGARVAKSGSKIEYEIWCAIGCTYVHRCMIRFKLRRTIDSV